MPPSSPPAKKEETLVIWDFDWTIANCNSDEYVPAYFLGVDAVEERFRDLYAAGVDWHSCVEIQMKDAADGFDDDEAYRNAVCKAASSMPYLEDVRRVMEELSLSSSSSETIDDNGEDGSVGRQWRVIEQAVVSDGNDLFIRSFLEGSNMLHLLSAGIVSNSASFISENEDNDDEENNPDQNESKSSLSSPAIKVVPVFGSPKSQFPKPHGCKRCPPNLCKSHVLQHLLSTIYSTDNDPISPNRPRIVYIGDGGNDSCPALEILNQNDFLFARDGRVPNADPAQWKGRQSDDMYGEPELMNSNDGTRYRRFRLVPTLEKVANAEGKKTNGNVYTWYTGKELYSLVSKHILQQ